MGNYEQINEHIETELGYFEGVELLQRNKKKERKNKRNKKLLKNSKREGLEDVLGDS